MLDQIAVACYTVIAVLITVILNLLCAPVQFIKKKKRLKK